MTTSVETPLAATAPVPDPTASGGSFVQQPVAVQAAAAAPSVGVELATFEELFDKPRRRLEFDVFVGSGGELVKRKMVYLALSGDEYDDLVAKNPPTPKQKAEGQTTNPDTFPPALISAVSHQPKLTVEQAKALWKHKEWSPGEQATLFQRALEVCQSGLSVPFSVSG